jgi:hypothetical protein
VGQGAPSRLRDGSQASTDSVEARARQQVAARPDRQNSASAVRVAGDNRGGHSVGLGTLSESWGTGTPSGAVIKETKLRATEGTGATLAGVQPRNRQKIIAQKIGRPGPAAFAPARPPMSATSPTHDVADVTSVKTPSSSLLLWQITCPIERCAECRDLSRFLRSRHGGLGSERFRKNRCACRSANRLLDARQPRE